MCTRYPIINRVSELKVHIELTRFVQPEKIEIDANERAVNEKSQYCFFVCTTFDSFLNDLNESSKGLCPLCFSLFFCCFNSNIRCSFASFFLRFLSLRSCLLCSCCNFNACCDFVPIPVPIVCFFTSRCIRFGFLFISFTTVSTAGLNFKLK